jgi:hypothetical protein
LDSDRLTGQFEGVMRLRCFALFLLLAVAPARASKYEFASLKVAVTHGDYGYRFVGRPRTKDFVLEAAVKTTAGGPAVRVVFGFQDPMNFYYAQATDTGCTFVRVEDGIERRLGAQTDAILPRDRDVVVTVVRRRRSMRLSVGGAQVAEAYDGRFASGRVGLSGRKDSVTVGTVRFQAVSDVRLADDFMRTAVEGSAWETVAGSWQLKALPSASLSANAFMYEGRAAESGQHALGVRGHWFWSDHVFSAAVQPTDDEAVGLAFAWRDAAHYHLLRWESCAKGGRLQLLRIAGEQRTVLGETARGFVPGTWYSLGVRTLGRRIVALVDGLPLLGVQDPHLTCGAVGIYTESPASALFDDVLVATPQGLEEDFERSLVGKWVEMGGTWQFEKGRLDDHAAAGQLLVASAKGEARLVSGEERWDDYTVAADLLPPTRGSVGLVGHYQDEANFYLFELSPDSAALVRVAEGERTELARQACTVPLGAVQRIELRLRRGVLTGSLGDRTLVRRVDRTLASGRVGLYVRQVRGAAFDNVSVTFPEPAVPLFTAHGIFSAEESMSGWAVRQSDWTQVPNKLDGLSLTASWHRADFPGDVEVQARIATMPHGGCLWLAIAGDGQQATSGYTVSLDHRKDAYRAAVSRQGKVVAQQDITLPRAPRLLVAERVGHALLALVDGKVVLTYEDAQPLAGRHVGWMAAGAKPERNGVELFSPTVRVYTFHKAPVDWRPVAGLWEVTNRWDCDPRWSFFAGERQGDTLVALWNKREFETDVTLEFAAGIRHDPKRGGTGYAYASDINAVLCGDGVDLRNGYGIVFAGWNNARTAILRNGKQVAQTTKFRFSRSSTQHRQWFYFKIQKQGPHVRLYVDNQLALEFKDSQPLTGRRLALWTWNNDIMVARVRISSDGPARAELPAGPAPAQPHCCYR